MTDFSLDTRKGSGSNLATDTKCATCEGDRFVLVGTRPPVQSVWMRERGIQVRTGKRLTDGYLSEEYAACPGCNSVDTSFRRHDGSVAKALDPAKVRQLMRPTASSSSRPTPPAESRRRLAELTKLSESKDVA